VVVRRQQQGTLAAGEIFSFEIFFKPNQNSFPVDLYKDAFVGENAAVWLGVSRGGPFADEGPAKAIRGAIGILTDSGDLNRDPLPDGDPYRITNRQFLADLSHRLGATAGDGGDWARRFPSRDDAGWERRKEIGSLKMEAIGFRRGTADLAYEGKVAVTLALALANQRIVLEKVQALSNTTPDLIAGTAERLKTQGAAIHKQASATQVDIDALKRVFDDVRSALEDISRYRQEALPKMADRILQMDKMAAESDEAIARVEQAERVAKDFHIEIRE